MGQGTQGRGIQQPGGATGPTAGQPLDLLSRSIEAEVRSCLARILSRHKAEAIAAECDRRRSTIYAWAGHPAHVPIGAVPILADFDPDPEFLARLAGHLLSHAASRALARQAEGGTVLILHQLGVRAVADPESIRRAMGRGDLGDD